MALFRSYSMWMKMKTQNCESDFCRDFWKLRAVFVKWNKIVLKLRHLSISSLKKLELLNNCIGLPTNRSPQSLFYKWPRNRTKLCFYAQSAWITAFIVESMKATCTTTPIMHPNAKHAPTRIKILFVLNVVENWIKKATQSIDAAAVLRIHITASNVGAHLNKITSWSQHFLSNQIPFYFFFF